MQFLRTSAQTDLRVGMGLAALLVSSGFASANPSVRHFSQPSAATPNVRHVPMGLVTIGVSSDPTALQALRQMLAAESSLALTGDQITTVYRADGPISSEQHVIRDGSRAMRIDYVNPPNLTGEQVIDNGHTFWHFIPAGNKLETGPSRLDKLRKRIQQVLHHLDQGQLLVQVTGRETIAGRDCGVIAVQSARGVTESKKQFWIDLSNGAQLAIKQFDANGQLRSESHYVSVEYPSSLPANVFDAPKTSKSVSVVPIQPTHALSTVDQAQAQVNFPIRQPAYLPAGYQFQSVTVSQFRQRPMVTLRYKDALNVISLFETPAGSNESGGQRRPRPGVVVTVQNGLHVIVVGNVSSDEMAHMLSSLH